MTDRLAELGAEFRRLRAEAARLKGRAAKVRQRTNEIRPLLAKEIAVSHLPVSEIVKITGYDRDSVRKIRLGARSATEAKEVE